MCKQTRAHTYEEKDSRTLGRNEEIKVWPLSAALISSCRLYLLNLLFLALVPSPDGVQPRANPLAPRPSPRPPSYDIQLSVVLLFVRPRALFLFPRARPTGSETGSNRAKWQRIDPSRIGVYFSSSPLHRLRRVSRNGKKEDRRCAPIRIIVARIPGRLWLLVTLEGVSRFRNWANGRWGLEEIIRPPCVFLWARWMMEMHTRMR